MKPYLYLRLQKELSYPIINVFVSFSQSLWHPSLGRARRSCTPVATPLQGRHFHFIVFEKWRQKIIFYFIKLQYELSFTILFVTLFTNNVNVNWRRMAEHGVARLLTVTMVTVSPDFRFNSHLLFIALFISLVISDKKEKRGEEREKKKLVHITWQQHWTAFLVEFRHFFHFS